MNERLKEYEIDNGILRLTALNYGACITGIYVKDKKGNRENVVASFDDMEDYVRSQGPYLNAVVGPTAGRIAYGTYVMNDTVYTLSKNSGKHHLHGGFSGISMKYFQVSQTDDSLHFHLYTTHETDGYPQGNYDYDVVYRLLQDRLIITLQATPPALSLLAMTNHLYFNLAGDMKEDIGNHELYIDACQKLHIHEDGHPDQIMDIEPNSAFDFQSAGSLHDHYNKGSQEFSITKGYDTGFLLQQNGLTLTHRNSGRCLNITSDAPCVVVYSANYFDDTLILNKKSKGYAFSALALELQNIPNAINLPCKDHSIYDPKHPFAQTTEYRFSLCED